MNKSIITLIKISIDFTRIYTSTHIDLISVFYNCIGNVDLI